MRAILVSGPDTVTAGLRIAACAATWCGVHCAVTPGLVAALPALALSEAVERGVFVATLLVGGLMLALGPARAHSPTLLTFASGAALWASSLAGLLEPWPENLTSAVGSLVLAAALFRSVRVCQMDDCTVCTEATERGGSV